MREVGDLSERVRVIEIRGCVVKEGAAKRESFVQVSIKMMIGQTKG